MTSAERNDFDEAVAELRRELVQAGMPVDVVTQALDGAAPVPRVAKLATSQPEHNKSVGAYISALVSDRRIDEGRKALRRHSDLFARIQNKFGVASEVLTAIWGIESNFGESPGTNPVIDSLVTLFALRDRRSELWRRQLKAAVEIIADDGIARATLCGSWAGAMGHMQFMPTTYREFAVDFDGDGCRDVWSSVPDALASAANYLAASGWTAGTRWGLEVRLPADFDFAANIGGTARPIDDWLGQRLEMVGGRHSAFGDDTGLRLLLPAGADGPAFLVSANFDAILTYNASTSYALAVALLADRITGLPPIAAEWPQEPELSTSERTELQHRLVALGYDTGGVDGILGRASRRAIADYQATSGLLADGYPSRKLLDKLRGTC